MDGVVVVNSNWGLIFLTQMSIGILGNSSFFCLHVFSSLAARTLKPMDLVLYQLVLANNLSLLSKVLPHTMAALGLTSFLDDTGCKCVFYVYRVARGTSLSTTCFLSSFQAMKISTRVPGWLKVRLRSPTFTGFGCVLCWVLQLLLNVNLIISVSGPGNNKNLSRENMYRYCSSPTGRHLLFPVIALIYSLSDGLCLGLMTLASGSMVLVLHRHKQRVQYLQRHCQSPRPSHEARATCTILVLVSLFVSFHSLSSVLSLCITQTLKPSHSLLSIPVLASSAFPAFSPYVFIVRDTHISQVFSVCQKRRLKGPA